MTGQKILKDQLKHTKTVENKVIALLYIIQVFLIYSFQSISDKAYNNAKYFKWDDIIGAANYIVEQIIDFNK